MSDRDDIVIRPNLGPLRPHEHSPRDRAKQARRLDQAIRRKDGVITRLLRARSKLGAARVAGTLGRRAAAGFAERAGGRFAGRAVFSPVGAVVAAVAVGVVVAARLASGRTFENMGQEVNNLLLGDLDENARASMQARTSLEGRDDVMQMLARGDRVQGQLRTVFDGLRRVKKKELDGRTLFLSDPDFQVNGKIDQVIERAAEQFKERVLGGNGIQTTIRALSESR